jgi:hypothetical protein
MRRLLAFIATTLLLAACAAMPFGGAGLPPGATRQDALAQLGNPTRAVRLADGGERLQYSQQPFGHEVWMVDLDAAGKVTGVRQVMRDAEFNRIMPGQWTREDVEREFGPPAQVDAVASWNGPIYTYRWRDLDRADMFYWVYFDRQNVVQRAHRGMEFFNAPDRGR